MKMTPEGLALIRQFEGFRGQAYRCPAGIWTIGYGHTSQAGPPSVSPGMTMSEGRAREVLVVDVERFAAGVRANLTRPVSDARFSALVSFAFNVGLGAFRSSSVLRAVNAGDLDAVPRRLQLWVKGGGRVLPGLVRRRAAEAAMFVGGGEGNAPPEAVSRPDPVEGKRLTKSTTVVAAIIAALAAVLPGPAVAVAGWHGALVPVLAGLAAAAWIIIERWKKAKEDGV